MDKNLEEMAPVSATERNNLSEEGITSNSNMKIQICPTTGGQFDLNIPASETIDGLKRAVGKKLKVPKDRITLLYKDRLLKEGTLFEHQVVDHSKITLLPNVESGLMTNKAENSVMQALENLTELQVNEFLAGKAPLTLAMRLGDHMMFVQLQLSTTQLNTKKAHKSKSNKNSGARLERQANFSKTSQTNNTSASQNTASPASMSQTETSTSSVGTSMADMLPSLLPIDYDEPMTSLDTEALAQASRNLSKRLKELSKVTCKPSESYTTSSSTASTSSSSTSTSSANSASNKSSSTPSSSSTVVASRGGTGKGAGAIIESMQHHGQGVYSGTFSGSLNPALQDKQGNPKKSINTIIHILNDLLGATPQYKTGHTSKHRERRERGAISHSSRVKSQGDHLQLNQENQALKGKVEHLQQMMEERRAKRKARREARSAPYNWSSDKQSSTESKDGETNAMEVDANVMTDNVTDTTLTQIKQETVMV
ncbi:unnamed protein product [Owenia fusiformis]|uniref:Uncharacterized protein n=1 Tax=Owenia fusiformis TaxID=6347 RepID=A0A8J1YBA5_OWEFU|nr:unnamed protein product [Owenia fusiformis]